MQAKYFNIALNGRIIRITSYVSLESTIYLAKLDDRVTAILVNDGQWRTYGGDKDNITLKSAIMEWNAVQKDAEAKLAIP